MIDSSWTEEAKRAVIDAVTAKYNKVASSPEGLFKYPTGRAGLETLQYDTALLEKLPDEVAAAYCGVGNPFGLGAVEPGQSVLDVGCGAGVDTILAGMMAGPSGRAVGVDVVPAMLDRARRNLATTDCCNVCFEEMSAEVLPFPERSFDVVISNGAFNLVPDKPRALAEVLRVLKPGGRFQLADQVLTGQQPADTRARIANWSR